MQPTQDVEVKTETWGNRVQMSIIRLIWPAIMIVTITSAIFVGAKNEQEQSRKQVITVTDDGIIPSNVAIERGEFCLVRVTEAGDHSLIGILISDGAGHIDFRLYGGEYRLDPVE